MTPLSCALAIGTLPTRKVSVDKAIAKIDKIEFRFWPVLLILNPPSLPICFVRSLVGAMLH